MRVRVKLPDDEDYGPAVHVEMVPSTEAIKTIMDISHKLLGDVPAIVLDYGEGYCIRYEH